MSVQFFSAFNWSPSIGKPPLTLLSFFKTTESYIKTTESYKVCRLGHHLLVHLPECTETDLITPSDQKCPIEPETVRAMHTAAIAGSNIRYLVVPSLMLKNSAQPENSTRGLRH